MARRKPHRPEVWTDTGPDTAAQRHGATYMQVKGGRIGEIRRYRQHPLEAMHARGTLSLSEKERGMSAVALFEGTQRGGGQLRERVDGRSDPDLSAVLQCDAQFAYARAVQDIPGRCKLAYRHVVEFGLPLWRLKGCQQNSKERRRQWLLLREALAVLRV